MQDMTNFTHPIELFDKVLDLVTAGWNNRGGCGCKGGGNNQVGLVDVGNVNILDHDPWDREPICVKARCVGEPL